MAAVEGGKRGFAAGLDSAQEFGVSEAIVRVHREVAAFRLYSARGAKRFREISFQPESGDGGAPASGFERGVGEGFDEGRGGEDGADHFALDADAAAVDDADGAEAVETGLVEELLGDGAGVARGDGVEVEGIGDGEADRFRVDEGRSWWVG